MRQSSKIERSLLPFIYSSRVANLGDASHFTIDHLDEAKTQELIEKARILYTAVCNHSEQRRKFILERDFLCCVSRQCYGSM